MDEYCALEEFFSELSDRFFNENENFVSQNWMPGFFIIWIICLETTMFMFWIVFVS